MQLEAIKAVIHDALAEVELLMYQQFDSHASLIKDIATHLIQAGGKRIRPTLVLLVGYAYQGNIQSSIALAVAIELIHAATLLHDDVVDNSYMRRSENTANAIWDNAASVLVGDFLYSRAFQLIVSVEEIAVLRMLAETTNIIATGEVLQLQNRHNPHITEQDYLDILRYKTGALFSAATQAGAINAKRSPEDIACMAQFGEALGLAFQLIDDLLDYTADEQALGKQLGDDLAEGKMTLPLIYAVQHVAIEDRAFIEQAIVSGERDALPRLISLVQSSGGLIYTRESAKKYARQACALLDLLPESAYQKALVGLTQLVVARDF
jgi:octaprenyl-diphosphate synthase